MQFKCTSAYLKQFTFNTLKIDRSLIKNLCLNSKNIVYDIIVVAYVVIF